LTDGLPYNILKLVRQ